ncbi:hypothetical protein BGY98DRAFT_1178382 [Russula aff. rugulosa BPL654]|nr:hypothetical protein BGY98DRAFT_1178382 [Russula aff. rugulosa BPL654]
MYCMTHSLVITAFIVCAGITMLWVLCGPARAWGLTGLTRILSSISYPIAPAHFSAFRFIPASTGTPKSPFWVQGYPYLAAISYSPRAADPYFIVDTASD